MLYKPSFFILFFCFPIFTYSQACFPTVTAYNGLNISVRPIDLDGDGLTDTVGAIVRLKDFYFRAYSPCGMDGLEFGIRKSGTGTGMTHDSLLFFDCTLQGTQLVEVWVRNDVGLANYSETYVIVQDNNGLCGSTVSQSTQCDTDILFPDDQPVNGLCAPMQKNRFGRGYLDVPVSAFVHATYENCDGPIEYRIRKSGTGSGVPAETTVRFKCSEATTQLVEIWAGDQSGNWSFNETYIIVQDNLFHCSSPGGVPAGCANDKKPPELFAFNGLSQGVIWEGAGPSVRVFPEDFIKETWDKCGAVAEWRIRKSGTGSGPAGTSANVRFDCNELGTQLVEIWARDMAGNWTYAESYVIVQDNIGACGPPPPNRPHVVIPEFKQDVVAYLSRVASERQANISVRQSALASSVVVWPNPAVESFTVSALLTKPGTLRVQLYDNAGRLVRELTDEQRVEAGVFQEQFQRDGLMPGLYRCVIQSAQGLETLALVLL